MILRDKQADRPIAIDVYWNDAARIIQSDLVEASLCRDVAKTRRSLITQQYYFSFACKVFAHSHQVDPAVVIVIKSGNPPAAHPLEIGKIHAFEGLALEIA